MEASILRDGCREPLTVWNDILADGHHRKEISDQNARSYQINYLDPVEFPDRDSVMLWMLDNQGGRRNLSDIDRTATAIKRESIIARRAKEKQRLSEGAGNKGMSKSTDLSEPILTRAAAAKSAGVGQTKYDEGKLILKAVESGEAPAQLIEDIRAKKISIHQAATEIKAARKPAPQEEEKAAPSLNGEYTAPEATPPPSATIAKFVSDDASRLWSIAKNSLDKILPKDLGLVRVMNEVIVYATARAKPRKPSLPSVEDIQKDHQRILGNLKSAWVAAPAAICEEFLAWVEKNKVSTNA